MWKLRSTLTISASNSRSVFKCSTIRAMDQIQVPTAIRPLLIAIVTLILISATFACTPSPPPEGKETSEGEIAPIVEAEQPDSYQLGEAVLDNVVSTSDGDTEGRILTVQVTNPTTNELLVTIPCGLIFNPSPGSDEQRLMVIQQDSATVPPGESADFTPYVVCIDSSNAVPATGSTYQIGDMATGDLLALAQCICDETLADIEVDPSAFLDQFGLQLAVWAVSDGLSFDEMFEAMEEAEGALGQIGIEEYGEGLEDLLGGITDIFQAGGQEWLEKCDIEIKP
jgi:hypothetical protein